MIEKIQFTLWKLGQLRGELIGGYHAWKYNCWDKDLDSTWCCDGHECGCDGESMRDVMNR